MTSQQRRPRGPRPFAAPPQARPGPMEHQPLWLYQPTERGNAAAIGDMVGHVFEETPLLGGGGREPRPWEQTSGLGTRGRLGVEDAAGHEDPERREAPAERRAARPSTAESAEEVP